MGFVSRFLEVLDIFKALVLLHLLDSKERRGLRIDMNFKRVSWRVLTKFSLTWFTGPSGLLLMFVLNASPFVFRLVLFLLKFMSSLAGWWIYLMVEAMDKKNEKMAGNILKKREHRAIQYFNWKTSTQSQKAIISSV